MQYYSEEGLIPPPIPPRPSPVSEEPLPTVAPPSGAFPWVWVVVGAVLVGLVVVVVVFAVTHKKVMRGGDIGERW